MQGFTAPLPSPATPISTPTAMVNDNTRALQSPLPDLSGNKGLGAVCSWRSTNPQPARQPAHPASLELGKQLGCSAMVDTVPEIKVLPLHA